MSTDYAWALASKILYSVMYVLQTAIVKVFNCKIHKFLCLS